MHAICISKSIGWRIIWTKQAEKSKKKLTLLSVLRPYDYLNDFIIEI